MGDPYQELSEAPPAYPGHFALTNNVRYLIGCASFEQFASTLRALIDPAKYCPFCRLRDPAADFIAKTGGWSLIENAYPKAALKHMLLIVPRRHVLEVRALRDVDWIEIGRLLSHAVEKGATAGGLLMRFGEPAYHSGTMPHLHFNVLCPTGESEYRAALAKDEGQHQQNYERMQSFYQDLVSRGGQEWLLAP